MRRSNGFAVAIVLLVSMVALMAIVSAATVSSLSGRQTATQERRASTALLAAESGLNGLVARSRSAEYLYDPSAHASVAAWLEAVELEQYSLPGGAVVELSVEQEDPTTGIVTIRSVGTAAGESSRVILQAFELRIGESALGLFARAALITQRTLNTNSANSRLIGRDSTYDSWLFGDRVLGEGIPGDYFIVESSGQVVKIGDAVDADGKMLVYLVPRADPPEEDWLDPTTPGTLVPFALDEPLTGRPPKATFAVNDTSLFLVGDTIVIGDGTLAGDREATVMAITDTTMTVEWAFSPDNEVDVEEGTPIRIHVPSAIVGDVGGCPTGPKIDEKLPEGCEQQDLSNLWEKTFIDLRKEHMLGISQCDSEVLDELNMDAGSCTPSYYGPDAPATQEWPNTLLSGVTWIDGAKTGNFNSRGRGGGGDTTSGRALCGEGVVILNTGVYGTDDTTSSINLNVSDCEFSGVLYVIGDVRIQGNLDSFSGTIIVETAEGTQVQGTSGAGAKSLYDPIAIRRALSGLPGGTEVKGFVGSLPATWRFGQN